MRASQLWGQAVRSSAAREGTWWAMELEEGSDGLGQRGEEWERGRWLVVHKSVDNLNPHSRQKS